MQPVALGERIVSLSASLVRMIRLVESAPAEAYPDPGERQIAIDEAKGAIAQHMAFETPFRPFG